MIDAIVGNLFGDLTRRVNSKSFHLGRILSTNLAWFATEDPDVVAVTFGLEWQLDEVYDTQVLDLLDMPEAKIAIREEASMTVNGECLFRPADDLVEDVMLKDIGYFWIDSNGPQENHDVFVRTKAIVIGQRRLPLVIKHPIDP